MSDPTDAPGWCLTSLYDFQSSSPPTTLRQVGAMAVSPDGAYLYVYQGDTAQLDRIHLDDFTSDDAWAVIGGTFNAVGLAVDSDGNVYAIDFNSTDVALIDPAGSVTASWTSLPAHGRALCMGADGFLYAMCQDMTIHRIDLTGTVTHIAALDPTSDERYVSAIAVASDGTIWTALDPPPSAGPDYGVNSVLRRYDGSTVDDIPIQPLVSADNDGTTETSYVGIFIDDEDHVLVPMVTYQEEQHPSTHGLIEFLLDAHDERRWWGPGVDGWTFTNCTHGTPASGHIEVTPDVGVSSYTVTLPPLFTIYDAVTIRALLSATCVRSTVFTPYWTVEVKIIDDSPGVVDTSGAVAQTQSPGLSFGVGPTPMPATADVGLEIEVVCTSGTFVGPTLDQTETIRLEQGALHGSLEMGPTLPNLSWFLRVAPDGTAERIAGTWSYDGTPGPDPDAAADDPPGYDFANNVQDGPLDTSLANEVDWAAGLSFDRRTLYFTDNAYGEAVTNRTGLYASALRKLARCRLGGWGVGRVKFGTSGF